MPICLTIHTERLHDDRLWKKTAALARFLKRHNARATWFAMSPICPANQQRGFNEIKWRERLKYLAEHNQQIEQHTHFYKDGKGEYDLSAEHVARRLREDKRWLESVDFEIKGFVSGGWRMNDVIIKALEDSGFSYDCTARIATVDRLKDRDYLVCERPKKINNLWEVPTSFSVGEALLNWRALRSGRSVVIYCHDYDLEKLSVRLALRWLVWTRRIAKFVAVNDFLSAKSRITRLTDNYHDDYDGKIKLVSDDVYIHPHDHKNSWDWGIIFNFLNKLKINQPASVLELGCGMGNVGYYYAKRGADVLMEDLNLSYLEQAVLRSGKIKGLLHDLNQPLPLADNSFDLVCCLGTLHYNYISDVKKILMEMKRVSGKYILVDLFSARSWWRPLERLLHPNSNPRRFLPQEAEYLFRELGLRVIRTTSTRVPAFISWWWPFSGKAVLFLLEKETKKVLVATGIFPPDIGGPATYSQLLLEKLPERGFEVRVLSYASNVILKLPQVTEESLTRSFTYACLPVGKAQDDLIFVSRKYPKGIRHLIYFWKCWRLAKETDAVYAQGTMSAGWPALLAAKLWRKPLVMRVAGDWAWEQSRQRFGVIDDIDNFQKKRYGFLVELLRRLQNTSARTADVLIVPSQYLKTIVRGWGVTENKIKVIYNAVKPVADYSQLSRQNNLILSAGRLVPWKGFGILIEAVQELVSEGMDLKLAIAGDGPEKEKLEKLILSQYKENILLLGSLSKTELAKQLHGAGVFVLNTGYEGFSHQLLEAMSVGLPVITTNVGGNPELAQDGVNSFLINYNDKEALKEKLRQLLNNPDLRQKFSEQGKATAAKFSEERMLNELLVILSELFCHSESRLNKSWTKNLLRGPDFIGIGAQRSGTSWIYACLYDHPQIHAPVKEINFFSRERNWQKGYAWYESILGKGLLPSYSLIKRSFYKRVKVGEFSTSYLASPETPERIYKKYPNVKLIVSLRDSVERAFSNYLNDIATGTVSAKTSFKEALAAHPEYINNGCYATHLKNFLRFFKKEQILILCYEDIKQDSRAFMKKIYEFIGVDSDFVPSMLNKKVGTGRVPRLVWLDRLLVKISAGLRRIGFNKAWWLIKKTGVAGLIRRANTKNDENQLRLKDEDRKMLEKIFEEDLRELPVILSEPLSHSEPRFYRGRENLSRSFTPFRMTTEKTVRNDDKQSI